MPRLDHINLHVRDTRTMVTFLETLLDAKEGFRPPFKRPGHWVYLDDHPAIHIDIPERTDDFPAGMVHHVAFGIYEKADVLARAEKAGYPFHHAEIPGTGIGQVFVTGPEGILVEVQYRQ
jgi:catechol 2,3-dioxygenase-like lactoylglutathione lyase family enzyme